MNELAVAQDMSIENMGDVFVKSGFFTDTRDRAQAIVKIMAGRELGISPIASMTGVYIVKGKPSMGANLIAACVKNSGRYNYRIITLTDTVCELEFFERFDVGQPLVSAGKSKFTIEDAKRAGTQNLDKFPRNMLFARAMSNGAKWYAASIFAGGIYTPDELGATVQFDETGEIKSVIEGEFKPETHASKIARAISGPEPHGEAAQDEYDLQLQNEMDTPHNPYWVDFEGLTVPDMNLETAVKEQNSKGVLYTDLTPAILQHMAREMATILMNGKTKAGPITDTARENYQYKLSAIRAILTDLDSK